MTKHSIEDFFWPDAAINSIRQDYEQVTLTATDCNGRKLEVICSGYIGQKTTGFWDEVIISKSAVVTEHLFISECVHSLNNRYGNVWPNTGSLDRNDQGQWKLWDLTLSDGASIQIVAKKFCLNIFES